MTRRRRSGDRKRKNSLVWTQSVFSCHSSEKKNEKNAELQNILRKMAKYLKALFEIVKIG